MATLDKAPSLRLPPRLEGLIDLAHDLSWSWDTEATALWRELDELAARPASVPEPLNPVRVLERVSKSKWNELAADRDFVSRVRELRGRLRSEQRTRRERGAELAAPLSRRKPVAYFSMEFAIHASLPFYSGGLGVLAGDHLKSASDIGLPLIGVGLAYRQGYFQQRIDRAGRMAVSYPKLDYGRLPMRLVRDRRGQPLTVSVSLEDGRRPVKLRIWELNLGDTSLCLLDSDFAANHARHRALCRHLYGGTREDRLHQEILLGIGGVRALRAMKISPQVWHLNEGHVTLCTLERLRELRSRGRRRFEPHAALERIAADTVFTTHTPVPAGNEAFDLSLARRCLSSHCEAAGIDVDEYLNYGVDRGVSGQPVLSMTVLALRLSRLRNGVSQLHGVVSREMWSHLWPDFDAEDSPIISITNGVHVPTWIAPRFDELFSEHIARNWQDQLDSPRVWQRARRIPDRKLWEAKSAQRQELIEFVRERVAAQLRRQGATARRIARETESLLDPRALTIGFARRFATYKRADLLFSDLKSAQRLFRDRLRPIQIIFSGKPHPQDEGGIRLFERIVKLSRRSEFRGKVVVLENYDMDVGAAMVRGVDLWLNNPRRPLEASGTSGQKVPFNGGLNCSVLDGWWDEGHAKDVGWAFGEPRIYEDLKRQDRDDTKALHAVLRDEIAPLFHDQDRNGVPRGWLRKVKASMAELIPRFNTSHMVAGYREHLYLPAVALAEELDRQRGLAAELVQWRRSIEDLWRAVHVRSARLRRGNTLEIELYAGGVRPADIRARLLGAVDPPVEVICRGKTPGAGLAVASLRLPSRFRRGARVRLWPERRGQGHPNETGCAIEYHWKA